jgi:hypothetical protein
MYLSGLSRAFNLLSRRAKFAISDIVTDGIVKEDRLLKAGLLNQS